MAKIRVNHVQQDFTIHKYKEHRALHVLKDTSAKVRVTVRVNFVPRVNSKTLWANRPVKSAQVGFIDMKRFRWIVQHARMVKVQK